uniref:Uncharacterized protein n=1 Tax=Phytophthora ramorum TaxID=164328 RepID=H3H5Z2_PHYRM
MEEDRLASSSPRSPKRPRASSPLSSAEKKRRLSPDDGTMRDDTLRIVAEALRSENRQLLQDRDVLKAEKKALDERLAQAQRSLRVLEDDMGRVYRQKQKDMETQRQECEQKLQSQNTILGRPAEREGSKELRALADEIRTAEWTGWRRRRSQASCRTSWLYAKFSSSMDSVSEKTMRLEELEQEMKDTKSDAQAMQDQRAGLEKQVAQLQEKLDLSAARSREKENVNDELATVQKQYSELKVVESQQKKLAGKMQSEMTELKAQNKALREQRVKKEHQSVGQPSNEGDKQSSAGADNALVIQTAEKEALRMFVQRYYSAAEDKCWKLLEKVSELEAQKTSAQEQTKESCNVLLMCAQVDTCDEAIRASLLDVVATLEGLT